MGVGQCIGTLDFRADARGQQKGILESQGRIKVREVYGELELPILSDMPLAHSLSVNLGLRYSDYTNDSLDGTRSEEHTSELQSLMRISSAVFCLKKKHNTRT